MGNLQARDGKLMEVDGKLTTCAMACCEPIDCDSLDFSVGATVANLPTIEVGCIPVDPCGTLGPTTGTTQWTVNWSGPSTGVTYKLWRAYGGSAPTPACPEGAPGESIDWALYGTYTEPPAGSGLVIGRVEPVTCNDNNFRCWALQVLIGEEQIALCYGYSDRDFTVPQGCLAVEVSSDSASCVPFDEGGVGTRTVNITLSATYDPACGDPQGILSVTGDGVSEEVTMSWTLTGGIYYGTGSLTVEFACQCPDISPCSTFNEITVSSGACSFGATV